MKSKKHKNKVEGVTTIYYGENVDKVIEPTSNNRFATGGEQGESRLEKKSKTIANKNNKKIKKESKFSQKKSKKFQCKYCPSSFTRQNNLNFHYKKCVEKLNYEKEKKEMNEKDKLIQEYKNKLANREKELEYKNEQLHLYKKQQYEDKSRIKHYQNDVKFYKNAILQAGLLVKDSISTMKFITTNYNNTPELLPPDLKLLKGFDNDDKEKTDDFVVNLVYSYKKKYAHEIIGNMIYNYYEKDDPSKQSLWSTDCSRNNYAIRHKNKKTKNMSWITDKKGHKMTKITIDPFIDDILKLLMDYQRILGNKLGDPDITTMEQNNCLEYAQLTNKFIFDIKNKEIRKQVLAYLSPKFQSLNKEIEEQLKQRL